MPHLVSAPINKDPKICDPESQKTRDLERLIVGPQGGVANTVVFLKDISAGKAMDIPQQRRFLDQKHCRYEPHILLVPSNTEFQMKSSDAVLHTVHMDGAATYNLPFPFPDHVISRQMPAVGLVNLKCNGGHTWMNAEMFTQKHIINVFVVSLYSNTFPLFSSLHFQLVSLSSNYSNYFNIIDSYKSNISRICFKVVLLMSKISTLSRVNPLSKFCLSYNAWSC